MSNLHLHRPLVAGLALATVATLLLPLAGCAADPQQVQMVSGNAVRTGLSPLERGEVRRTALDTAKKGMDAWLAGDTAAMKKYWEASYVTFYEKQAADYRAEGKVKVRRLEDVSTYDVTDMNDTGTEVIVDIYFADGGYYTDLKGKATSKPSMRQTQIQLTLDKAKGSWTITRMIAGNEIVQ